MLRFKRLTSSAQDVAALQLLLYEAPHYARLLTGGSVKADAAAEMLAALPPGITHENKFVFGVLVEQELIGCVDLIRGYPRDEVAFIGLLLISEAHENKGYGTKALQEICQIAQEWKCPTVRLGVLRANARAIRFWEKLGFSSTGEAKPYESENIKSEVLLYERALVTAA